MRKSITQAEFAEQVCQRIRPAGRYPNPATVKSVLDVLIVSNRPFALSLVESFLNLHPDLDCLKEDLQAIALAALVKVVHKFPQNRPEYPVAYIRKSIINALKDKVGDYLDDPNDPDDPNDNIDDGFGHESPMNPDVNGPGDTGKNIEDIDFIDENKLVGRPRDNCDESLAEALVYCETDQQRAIVRMVDSGISQDDIADELGLSSRTQVSRDLEKIDQHRRAGRRFGATWFNFSYPAYDPTPDNKRIALYLWPDRVNYRVHQAISAKSGKYVYITDGEAETIARNDTEWVVKERLKINDPGRPIAKVRPRYWGYEARDKDDISYGDKLDDANDMTKMDG